MVREYKKTKLGKYEDLILSTVSEHERLLYSFRAVFEGGIMKALDCFNHAYGVSLISATEITLFINRANAIVNGFDNSAEMFDSITPGVF